MIELNDAAYEQLTEHVYDISGIVLTKPKKYFVSGRLTPLLEKFGLKSYQELIKKSSSDIVGRFRNLVIDAITINETSFFRDQRPFKLLQHKLIPEALDRAENSSLKRRVKIWSAACSTGQEPYSIAMTSHNLMDLEATNKIQIYATDISEAATIYASAGIYSDLELNRGVPNVCRSRYFEKKPEGWRVKDEVRGMLQFGSHNLMKPLLGARKFDIIFCRYVAIYFTPEDRAKAFQMLVNSLYPGGSLIIGGAEILPGTVQPVIKRRHFEYTYYEGSQ